MWIKSDDVWANLSRISFIKIVEHYSNYMDGGTGFLIIGREYYGEHAWVEYTFHTNSESGRKYMTQLQAEELLAKIMSLAPTAEGSFDPQTYSPVDGETPNEAGRP